MKYYEVLQQMFCDSGLYQDFLSQLPVPFSNPDFDMVCLIGLGVYLVYRVGDEIYIIWYHRQVKRRHEELMREKQEKEREMWDREQQMQEKEAKLGRAMDFMAAMFTHAASQGQEYREREPVHGALGWRRFFLEKRERMLLEKKQEADTEYDRILQAHARSEDSQRDIDRQKEHERQVYEQRIQSLDAGLQREISAEHEQMAVENGRGFYDPELEKRKERARRIADKEMKKELKKEQKQAARLRRKGERHGFFR